MKFFSFFNKIRAFRLQQSCRRRALARYSSAILACGILATIPNAFLSCKKNPNNSDSNIEQTITLTLPSGKELEDIVESIKERPVDKDITNLTANMMYAEIFNMMVESEVYQNKILKIKGLFQIYPDEQTGESYYSVLVPDAAACCQQGIEFICPPQTKYPEDFPEVGKEFTVTGLFTTIELDGGITYNYLIARSLEF